MGGACDEQITGGTIDEMMENGMKHMQKAHPKMAADIKAMKPDDPKMIAWSEKFKKDFAAAPEVEDL